MLSRCANSQCCKPFLRLREGKLFLVETERVAKAGESSPPPFVRARKHQRLVEHYWLCDECASRWTLMYSRERGISITPLAAENACEITSKGDSPCRPPPALRLKRLDKTIFSPRCPIRANRFQHLLGRLM